MVTIAVEGCAHGELDNIYATILETQRRNPKLPKIELLICCGDFQAVRNESDLDCMNVRFVVGTVSRSTRFSHTQKSRTGST